MQRAARLGVIVGAARGFPVNGDDIGIGIGIGIGQTSRRETASWQPPGGMEEVSNHITP